MRVNVELARTTEETGHVEPGPTLPLELDILLNSSVMFDSILQQIFCARRTLQSLLRPSRGDLMKHADS